jgi:putative transposase
VSFASEVDTEENTMKSKRHTEELVIKELAEGDKMLREGKAVAEVARSLGVIKTTWHRWKNTCGEEKATDAKKLKELEMENRKTQDDCYRSSTLTT